MDGRTALVTGGAGFIGSTLVRGLLDAGYMVRVLDDFSTGRATNLAGIGEDCDIIRGDVRDFGLLAAALQGVEVVFHEAANVSVPRSVEDPIFNHELNATATLAILIAARQAGVSRLVYASSTAVYGESPRLPISEEMPTRPLSPYGASKLAGENYCSAFFETFGVPTVSLRYFNVFGPRQDPRSQYAAVIPRFIDHYRQGRQPTIFGDGEQTRDFVFVDDVVRANLLAAEAPDVALGRAFNVASGISHSVNELAAILQELTGGPPPVHSEALRGDIQHSVADIRHAREVLGFEASVPFEEGLLRTMRGFADGSQD